MRQCVWGKAEIGTDIEQWSWDICFISVICSHSVIDFLCRFLAKMLLPKGSKMYLSDNLLQLQWVVWFFKLKVLKCVCLTRILSNESVFYWLFHLCLSVVPSLFLMLVHLINFVVPLVTHFLFLFMVIQVWSLDNFYRGGNHNDLFFVFVLFNCGTSMIYDMIPSMIIEFC